ncbi:MAG: DUF512 domain-containing protein [Anaerolineales bacterium]
MPQDANIKGGVVSAVRADSLGAACGVQPGDRLLAINGHSLRDVIDYRYHAADEFLVLEMIRDGERQRLEMVRGYGQDLGLEFAEPVFDGVRRCNNHCPFCFLRQMPPGLRPSLYVRDDDYRYSFLFGNFITLTNLTGADWKRIGAQHLTPLYVSIHATALALRRELLGNPQAPDILQQLQRLGEMDIRVHGQIVIVPGMNDGQALRASIEKLLTLYPTVQTLALVPVGLTRFQTAPLRTLYPREAAAVLDMSEEYIVQARKRLGRTWLYPSDELYLLADRPLPPADFYDDDAQLENGAGLVRALLDDWQTARPNVPGGGEASSITLVCGTLIAPLLRRLADELSARWGGHVRVVPVPNDFFGRSVTVSGLLMGEDVLATLDGEEVGKRVFLPCAMFGSEARRTLDDLTREDIEEALCVPVTLASRMGDVVETLDRT